MIKQKLEKWFPVNKKVNRNKQKHIRIYLGTLMFFVAAFVGILFAHTVEGDSLRGFPNTPIGERFSVGNGINFTLLQTTFNEESGLFRADIFVDDGDSFHTVLDNLSYKVETTFRGAGGRLLDTEVVVANDNYFAIFVQDVPRNFTALSIEITPTLLHSEVVQEGSFSEQAHQLFILSP